MQKYLTSSTLARTAPFLAALALATAAGLAPVAADDGARADLQVNLVRSHAAGVGPSAPRDVVRAMLLLRAASPMPGFSSRAQA